jgi:chemotaxis protein MotB
MAMKTSTAKKLHEIDDEPASAPLWVLTYGDLMSLLLAFFVLLVSMSKFREVSHTQAMVSSLQNKFCDTSPWTSVFHGLNSQPSLTAERLAAIHRWRQIESLRQSETALAPRNHSKPSEDDAMAL